jgi:hypothetical protein
MDNDTIPDGENHNVPDLEQEAEKSCNGTVSDKTAGIVINTINHEMMNEVQFQKDLVRKLWKR